MSQEAVVHNYVGQDKSAIADAFGKAATTYDKHAEFQRDVGHRLLDKLPSDLSGLKVLDLGCGTGYFSEQIVKRGAEVVCADLSAGMLKAAEQRCGASVSLYQQADAEQLPFKDGCFDIVFSSLALQWCDDLSSPLKEMKRVVAVGGRVIFSTLLDGSLFELEKSWFHADQETGPSSESDDYTLLYARSHIQKLNFLFCEALLFSFFSGFTLTTCFFFRFFCRLFITMSASP